MARPRSDKNLDLPANLHRPRPNYYAYRDPVTGKTRGLGNDKDAAIRYANTMNESLGVTSQDSPRGAGLNIGKLLEAEYIIDFAKSVRKICGIYVLMHEREIVYVGQSTNCHIRIGNHLSDPDKVFDSYFVIECKECFLDELESSYIIKFRPKYNIIIPKFRKEIARFTALAVNL